MFSFFTKKPKHNVAPLTTDVHSHLLAALDDGVKTHEEAYEIINVFLDLGYMKVITTPHIMSDYYKNNAETIGGGLALLRDFLAGKTEIRVDAAAEYYLDENLLERVGSTTPLLTFGNKHLLFETNFISEPLHLKEFVFKATSSGYKPVLAHPERYQYMTMAKAEDLRDRGVLLQVNSLSLIGYYSAQVQRMAMRLIDQGWVDLLGSDCHNPEQARLLPEVQKSRYYQKALALPLLNHSL